MAALPSVMLVALMLGVCVCIPEMMRRENGILEHDPGETSDLLLKSQGTSSKSKVTTHTECNQQFFIRPDQSDVCDDAPTGNPEIDAHELGDEVRCTHAARELLAAGKCTEFNSSGSCFAGYVAAMNSMPIVPYVHKCQFNSTTNMIYFNPLEPNTTDGVYIGQKVCWRRKYAEMATVSGQTGDLCTCPDCVAVSTYQECWDDATCAAGGENAKTYAFKIGANETVQTYTDRPLGCSKDDIGEWGFNYADASAISYDGDAAAIGSSTCTIGKCKQICLRQCPEGYECAYGPTPTAKTEHTVDASLAAMPLPTN